MNNLSFQFNRRYFHTLFISLLLVTILLPESGIAQVRNPGGVVDPAGSTGEWIGGNGKVYTLGTNVGIGTSAPARKLQVFGTDHEYFRVTSVGGAYFPNSAAGIELERRLDNGTVLNWDIVNQGTFRIRRNATSLFLMDEDEAQFGTATDLTTLNIFGKQLIKVGDQFIGGGILLRSGTDLLRMDGNNLESNSDLRINTLTNNDLGINTIDSEAKLNVAGEGYQLKLINNTKSWRIGVSAEDWFVGEGKLVFSNVSSSGDALMVMTEQGRVGIGMTTPNRTLDINGSLRSSVLEVNGKTTTNVLEITGGADLAEHFDIAGAELAAPGMVVSIDPDKAGGLCISSQANDKKVAGIISGAGDINPGMIMGQKGTLANGQHPVALTGRVYCLVDASYGTIQPGDLLTTSNTPGHAMKVSSYEEANGAIIGKAMTSLEDGKDLVLVLVSLQ